MYSGRNYNSYSSGYGRQNYGYHGGGLFNNHYSSGGLFGGGRNSFALGAGAGFLGGAMAGVAAMSMYHRYFILYFSVFFIQLRWKFFKAVKFIFFGFPFFGWFKRKYAMPFYENKFKACLTFSSPSAFCKFDQSKWRTAKPLFLVKNTKS